MQYLCLTGPATGSTAEINNQFSNVTVVPSNLTLGGYAFQITQTSGATENYNYQIVNNSGIPTFYARTKIQFSSFPTGSSPASFLQWAAASAIQISLLINSSGNIVLYPEGGSNIVGTTQLVLGVTYTLTIMLQTTATANYFIAIDGNTELSGSMIIGSPINIYQLYILGRRVSSGGAGNDGTGATYTCQYGDIAVHDSFIPPSGGIVAIKALANGTYTSWSPLSGTLVSNVQDLPNDADVTFIYDNVLNDKVSFTVGGILPANASINCIAPCIVWRTTDGTGGENLLLRVNSTDVITANAGGAGGSPIYAASSANNNGSTISSSQILHLNPNTNQPWTITGALATEVGAQINTISTSGEHRITAAYLMVDYYLLQPNVLPRPVLSPAISQCVFSTADTSRTAPTNAVTLVTATLNGTLLQEVKIVATGTTSADVVRIFVVISSVYYLLYEMLVAVVTPSSTQKVFSGTYTPEAPCWLPYGAIIAVTTNGGQAYIATAFSENY